jgi:hypothetical protein
VRYNRESQLRRAAMWASWVMSEAHGNRRVVKVISSRGSGRRSAIRRAPAHGKGDVQACAPIQSAQACAAE